MIATSGFLTALECIKFVFGRISAPDPTGGNLQHSPRPSVHGLKGSSSKGKGKRRESGKGRERERKGPLPLLQIPRSAPGTMQRFNIVVNSSTNRKPVQLTQRRARCGHIDESRWPDMRWRSGSTGSSEEDRLTVYRRTRSCTSRDGRKWTPRPLFWWRL